MSPFLYICCHCEKSGQEPLHPSRPLALTRSTTKPHIHHRHAQHKNPEKHQHTMTPNPSSTIGENGSFIPSTISTTNHRNNNFSHNQIHDIRKQLQDESLRHQDRATALRQQLEDESLRHRMRSLTLRERLRDLNTRQRLRSCLSFGRSIVDSGGHGDSGMGTRSGDRCQDEIAEGDEGEGPSTQPARSDHILDWIGELRSVSLLTETASTGSRVTGPRAGGEIDGGGGREGSRVVAERSDTGRAGSVAGKDEGRSGGSVHVVAREGSGGSHGTRDMLGVRRYSG